MILETLIKLLKENDINVVAFNTSNTTAITYEFVNLTSDKVKRQDRLTLNIINPSYIEAIRISEKIKSVLLTLGDDTLQNVVNRVELNGGGTMFNESTKTYHLKQIYIIKSKEKRC